MATFDQKYQQVNSQVNGDQVWVGDVTSINLTDADRIIGDLAEHIRSDHRCVGIADVVLPHLDAARVAAGGGDRDVLLRHLASAIKFASPVAEIVTVLAGIFSGLQG